LSEYDDAASISKAIDEVRAHTMVGERGLASLWQQIAYVDRVQLPGSLVECGVWQGGASAMMALANLAHGPTRDLHLFDSFIGIPEPDAAIDGERAVREVDGQATGALQVALDYANRGGPGSPDEVVGLLTRLGFPADRIVVHQGWFQHTIPPAATSIGPIAVLRLDGDWYASTKVCLDHLYDLVVPGGFVIIDDYGAYDGCRRATNEFLARLPRPPFVHHVDVNVRYVTKD
jgi:hypothetical protein